MEFSTRISSLKPSAIREILKVTQDPTVISFAAGNPAPETFPAEEMSIIAADLFANRSATALQYGITEGYAPLRDAITKRMHEKYGVGGDGDITFVTTGGQQVIELAAKVLVNEGDTVLCEAPSFVGALNAFRSYKANLVGIPMDAEGVDVDRLEQALKTEKNVKLVYLIPTFQNPSGCTLSLERRKRVAELAEKYNVYVIEDNPYFDLRYSGEYVPPIKCFDKAGRIIYAGSFSKVLSPGIRIGYTVAPAEVANKMIVAKQVSDVHTNLFFQMLVGDYLMKYDLDQHIAQICDIYKKKCNLMIELAEKNFGDRVSFIRPDGGLFMWFTIPGGRNSFDFCKMASAKKVAAVPGNSFSVDESEISSSFRLNFSLATPEQMQKGMAILGETLTEFLK